jgi:hypothetical protein
MWYYKKAPSHAIFLKKLLWNVLFLTERKMQEHRNLGAHTQEGQRAVWGWSGGHGHIREEVNSNKRHVHAVLLGWPQPLDIHSTPGQKARVSMVQLVPALAWS